MTDKDLVAEATADDDVTPWLPPLEEPRRRPDPNAWMRPISIGVSGVAFLCMAVGFLWFVGGSHGPSTLPGEPGVPLQTLFRAVKQTPAFALMSLGIVLLGILPVLRVGLALAFYLRERARGDVLAAIAVLTLLIVSMFLK